MLGCSGEHKDSPERCLADVCMRARGGDPDPCIEPLWATQNGYLFKLWYHAQLPSGAMSPQDLRTSRRLHSRVRSNPLCAELSDIVTCLSAESHMSEAAVVYTTLLVCQSAGERGRLAHTPGPDCKPQRDLQRARRTRLNLCPRPSQTCPASWQCRRASASLT